MPPSKFSSIKYEWTDLGQKLHSWEYKTPHDFEDKTVLVVGIGSSAGDIAAELGRIAKQVLLLMIDLFLAFHSLV